MEHTESYNHYHGMLENVSALYKKYNMPMERITEEIDSLDKFQVTTPLIGEFSTGKSSLINAMLGSDYLGINLLPETSVPAEICYGDKERAVIQEVDKNAETTRAKEMSLAEFKDSKLSASNVKKAQIFVNNDFLRTVSTVKLVDMPGFNSGLELHNRAIDEYMPESLAYIITFSARDPAIPADMATFLRELKLHDAPVYLLITKSKSVLPKELDQCVARIREDAKKYLGLKDVNISCTNAKGKPEDINAEPLREILSEIEGKSQSIFEQEATRKLKKYASELAIYLETSIREVNATPSEIEAQEAACARQLARLQEKIGAAREDFSSQIDASLSNFRARLTDALNAESGALENMIMNGSDVKDKITMIVRENAIVCMKEDFSSRLKRYVERIAEAVKLDLSVDTNLQLNAEQLQIDSAIKDTIKKSLPVILSAIGIAVGGPVGAVIGAVVGLVADIFFAKKQQNEKRRMAREKVCEIIPSVTEKAVSIVCEKIREQVDNIGAKIDEDVSQKIAMQEKALADLKERHAEETADKEKRLAEMKSDLATAKQIMQEEA
ncbi:MAG: dynamin family protein [Anaerovibrio sp.]|nr:dynamin family protein [Anaerovibrio sp.]